MRAVLLLAALGLLAVQARSPEEAHALDIPRVLFLTHSAGFVHDVVKRPEPGKLAPAEQIFTEMAAERFRVTCSQDCADLTAAELAHTLGDPGREKELRARAQALNR